MTMSRSIPPIVVMGVQGSGKSTIGGLLAERLGVPYVEGDRLHPAENVERMAAGLPLGDEHRAPWLDLVGRTLADAGDGGIVVACSALKHVYRDRLRAAAPGLFIVHPEGSYETVAGRIAERRHEFMPTTLLRSQFDALEGLGADEAGITVDLREAPAEIVDRVVARLAPRAEAGA